MKTRHLHRLLQGTAECDSAVESLILILEAAVELVSIPGSDFCWSYWADEFKAKAELQALIHSLKTGTLPERLNVAVLFAPTGPLRRSFDPVLWLSRIGRFRACRSTRVLVYKPVQAASLRPKTTNQKGPLSTESV